MVPEKQHIVVLVALNVWMGIGFALGASAGWGFLFPILLGVLYRIGVDVWQTEHNMSDAIARRGAAVDAARKSAPSTEPEQMKLFGSGLIE